MTTLTVALPQLHSGQRAVWDSPARFQVMACGRRFGKSRLGALMCVARAIKGQRVWWVAPTFPMASIGWRMIRRLTAQLPFANVRESERMVMFPSGGSIQVKSADNPDSLRGEGLNFVVMDECAFMLEDAWTEALRPALADRKGGALFISTPKGRNWFWRLWHNADGSEWRSWRFTSYDNPYLDPREIDAAKEQIPELKFRQEFMAEFIEDGANVFRYVEQAATAQAQENMHHGHSYVMGLDWAMAYDFTVLTVFDATTRELVYMDRYNGVEYGLQRQRIKAVCDKFRPVSIVAEENAMGRTNNDELRRMGLPVRDFTTTAATKAEIIEQLAAAFERGTIRILNNPVLIGELQAYESERTASGLVRYNAPEGLHDDTVISLALSHYGASMGRRRATSKEY